MTLRIGSAVERQLRRSRRLVLAVTAALPVVGGCGRVPAARYTPVTRQVTITTLPLLVKEQVKLLPFLGADFAPGGVLAGKEVYGFYPSAVTAGVGDTLHFTFLNPEDDAHSFVLGNLVVQLPGQQVTHATWIAPAPGIFPFICAIPSHQPMMRGEIVVLAPAALAGGGAPGVSGPAAAPSGGRAQTR